MDEQEVQDIPDVPDAPEITEPYIQVYLLAFAQLNDFRRVRISRGGLGVTYEKESLSMVDVLAYASANEDDIDDLDEFLHAISVLEDEYLADEFRRSGIKE